MDDYPVLGVTGAPVFHSLSPELFSFFRDEEGSRYKYLKVFANSALESVELIRGVPLLGLNITAPFKTDIIRHLDELDVHAERIGAVNLVKREEGGRLKGYNTDHVGVVRSLKRYGFKVNRKHILVLGGGGAGRAAAYGLKNSGGKVFLSTRDEAGGQKTAEKLGITYLGKTIPAGSDMEIDLIVDTVPPGVKQEGIMGFRGSPAVFRADYKNLKFNGSGELLKAGIPDGIDWLYEQGEESHRIFFGRETGFPDRCYSDFRQSAGQNRKGESGIFLIGFTGCGKSTVGKIIAERTGFKWIDLDEEISRREKSGIYEIFRSRGEAYFREVESGLLAGIDPLEKMICSCGGGVVNDPWNREILKRANTVWIHTDLKEILKRIDRASRPVISDKSIGEINDLFRRRSDLYSESATVLIRNHQDAESTAAKIIDEIF